MMLLKNKMLLDAVSTYISKALGLQSSFLPWENVKILPLLYKERYTFMIIRIEGNEYLLLMDNGEIHTTPAVLEKQMKTLSQYWDGGILYAKETVTPLERTRLMRKRIPFIIPEKQLYLPFLGMDFNELFPKVKDKGLKISPTAQLLVLGKLYKKEWIDMPPTSMSKNIGITNMSIGRAFNELEQHEIVTIRKAGREKHLAFSVTGKELLEQTLPLLRSPITKTATVPFHTDRNYILAGESALSHYSMLSEPAIPTFAVSNRLKNLNPPDVDIFEDPMEDMIIQKWSYDPRVLSSEGITDPLSTYLTLRDIEDARVEQALEELLKEIPW